MLFVRPDPSIEKTVTTITRKEMLARIWPRPKEDAPTGLYAFHKEAKRRSEWVDTSVVPSSSPEFLFVHWQREVFFS